MIYQKSLCWTLRFLTANPWKSWASPWNMICRGIYMWIKLADGSIPFFITSANLSNTCRLISRPDSSSRLSFLTFYMQALYFRDHCLQVPPKHSQEKLELQLGLSMIGGRLIAFQSLLSNSLHFHLTSFWRSVVSSCCSKHWDSTITQFTWNCCSKEVHHCAQTFSKF
jgi:hypothetical protein